MPEPSPLPPRNRGYLISCAVFAVLLLLVGYPALTVLLESLRPGGQWGLSAYARLWAGPRLGTVVGSSLGVALAGSLLASLMGRGPRRGGGQDRFTAQEAHGRDPHCCRSSCPAS